MDYKRYQSVLQDLGLNPQESLIYELLLQSGSTRASELAKRSRLSRTNIYNIVNSLIARGLVSADRNARQLLYSPMHPGQLSNMLDRKYTSLADTKKALDGMLKDMVGDFMLGLQRPSVVTFDGREGIIRAYEDLLNDRLPLQSIQDMVKLDRFLAEYNSMFIKERVRRRIKHRLIAPESTRTFATTHAPPFREVRYLPDNLFVWDIDLKVTRKKVVITTFVSEMIAGIVLIHPDISNSLLSMFETLWAGSHLAAA